MSRKPDKAENPFLFPSVGDAAPDDSEHVDGQAAIAAEIPDVSISRVLSDGDFAATNPAFQMAPQLFGFDYHPVVIFGGPNSGKTSFVTSMLASLKLSADWQMSAALNEPVISTDTEFGLTQKNECIKLFYQTVQGFINGQAAIQTSKKLAPVFLPLTVRSSELNQTLNIALMESSGEYYSPDPTKPEYFAKLRSDTEAFIRDFEGGISFVYVLPYTQVDIRSSGVDRAADPRMLRDAEAAVVGMIQAYAQIRVNKSRDFHLLLITKWDAHYDEKKQEEELEMAEILTDTYEDIETFLRRTYPQALAALSSLQVADIQKMSTNYCAGLITGRVISPTTKDNETRDAIRSHQKKLWKWIWRNAIGEPGSSIDPFPKQKAQRGVFAAIDRLLERVF